MLARSCRRAALAVQPLVLFGFLGSPAAELLDFETRADGTPITTSTTLSGAEWSGQGVIFRDSFGSGELVEIATGRTFSVPTTFTTGFLSVTVSGGTTTFAEMDFSTPVARVDFDFLVRLPTDRITLTAFDSQDVVLASFDVFASETLTNPRITPEGGGHATVQGSGEIARLRVEAAVVGGVLGIDNLDFEPMPEAVPAVSVPTLVALASALVIAGARTTRRSIRAAFLQPRESRKGSTPDGSEERE